MSGIDSASDVQSYTPLDKIRIYLGGNQVNTTPRHLNFSADDFLATEDVINNRIDVALTKILKDANDRWKYTDAAQTGQSGLGDLIHFDGLDIYVGANSQTVPRGAKIGAGLSSSVFHVVGADIPADQGKTRLGGINKRIQFDETGLTTLRNFQFRDLAGIIPVFTSNGANVDLVGPASSRQYTLRDAAGVLVPFGSNGANVSLVGPASAQTYTAPNATGTLALTSDIAGVPEDFQDWRNYQSAYHSVTKGDFGGGLWAGILWSEGTFGYIHSTTNYSRGKWTTAGADNARAGWITEYDFTRGDLNPRADFKVQGSNTDVQRFFGFVGGTAGTVLDLDSALNTAHCFGLWISTAGTNVQTGRNDADGSLNAQDLTPTTTIASGGVHTVSIYTEDEGVTWHLVFDGTDNSYTTDIPTANETLGFMGCVQVRSGVAAKNFEMRYCQFHHDMG